MKARKTSLAMLAAAGLLSLASLAQAQDATNSPAAPPPPAAGRRGPGGGPSLEMLSQQLSLTDEQKPKVKAVLEDRNKQMQEARSLSGDERQAKVRSIREDVSKKLKEILTADQFKKFEEIQQRGRGPRGGAPGGAPGGAQPGGNAGGGTTQ